VIGTNILFGLMNGTNQEQIFEKKKQEQIEDADKVATSQKQAGYF